MNGKRSRGNAATERGESVDTEDVQEAPPREERAKEPEPRRARSASDEVTNRCGSPISILGVTIQPGEKRSVPGLDRDHGVVARWIDAGVIEV